MFWNKYPYTDFHELNLDMILKMMKDLDHAWDEFKAVNTITNAGAWDITKQYQAWTVVSDNNAGYISMKPVPAGVAITNTEYWGLIADYDILITDLSNRISALETTVGDASSGLVKDVDDLQTAVGDATSGLVKDVADLQTTVGDANGGLVKDVDDLQTDVVNLQTTVGDSSSGIVKDVSDLQNDVTDIEESIFFNGKKILILGDSISDENVHPSNWVTSFRSKFPDAIITNDSLNGRWLSQVPSLLNTYDGDDYDIVIVFAGINDYINSAPLGSWGTGTDFTDSLRKIGSGLQTKKCHTYFITSLCTTRTGSCPLNVYRSTAVEACKYWGLNWINGGAFPHLGGNGSLAYMSDGLHPDPNYADIMADYIAWKLITGGDTSDCDNVPYEMDMPAAAVLSAVTSASKRKMYFKNGELHLLLEGAFTFNNDFYTAVLTSPFDSVLSKANSAMTLSRYTCVVTQNNEVVPATAWLYAGNIIIQHGYNHSGSADIFLDVALNLKQIYI